MKRSVLFLVALLASLTAPAARASSPAGLTSVRVSLVTGTSLSRHLVVTTGVTTPAAHTATHARRHAHHHLRHAHRHRPLVDTGAHGRLARSDGPGPGAPVRHGTEHHAAVPSAQSRSHSGPSGSRNGPAALATLTAFTTSLPASRLVLRDRPSLSMSEGRTISGRGPPGALARCAPSVPAQPLLPARRAAGPTAGTAPAASAHAAPDPRTRPSPATALPCRATSVDPEPVRTRSLVRRPEGATASLDPPSTGDTP